MSRGRLRTATNPDDDSNDCTEYRSADHVTRISPQACDPTRYSYDRRSSKSIRSATQRVDVTAPRHTATVRSVPLWRGCVGFGSVRHPATTALLQNAQRAAVDLPQPVVAGLVQRDGLPQLACSKNSTRIIGDQSYPIRRVTQRVDVTAPRDPATVWLHTNRSFPNGILTRCVASLRTRADDLFPAKEPVDETRSTCPRCRDVTAKGCHGLVLPTCSGNAASR